MRRATVLVLVVLVLAGALLTTIFAPHGAADAARRSPLAKPGVYAFYDWQHLDPKLYPIVGGHVTLQWKALQPSAAYDWSVLDSYLARDAALGKVDGVGLDVYDGPCCGGSGVPAYLVKKQPELELACPGETPGATEIVPRYWAPEFQAAYGRFIADFGARFDGDPRIAFLQIGVGLFGETQPGRDEQDACLEAAGLSSDAWLTYAKWAMDAYRAAFPHTPLVLEYAPRYLYVRERRELADYAASHGVGLQHSGLTPDSGGVALIDDPTYNIGAGQYDPMLAWQGQTVLGWEGTEWGEHVGPAATLWRIYNALDKHPDYILLDAPQVTDPARRAMLEFANRYVAHTVQDAPGVWAALRETEYGWFPQRGNYEYWLYQVHDAPGGRTVPLWRVGSAPEGRFTRRTDEATGNRYMVFDVDDRYLRDVQAAPVTVSVTYLDQGTDAWAVDYDARDGTVRTTDVVTKTNTGRWLTQRFVLPDAALANRLPGGADHPGSDLRIDSRGDGDETVHLVLVQGDERPADPAANPEPTAEASAPAPAPTDTPTPGPTPTSVYQAPPPTEQPKRTPTPFAPPPPPNGLAAYGTVE